MTREARSSANGSTLLDEVIRANEELKAALERQTQQQRLLEESVARLAVLVAATSRLYARLDRSDVLVAIREIVANLVGAEEVAIFERTPHSRTLTLIAASGVDVERYRAVQVGVGPIGQTAATGEPFLVGEQSVEDPDPDPSLTACFPLKLNDRITGVVAIFRLLPQKPAIEASDRELFGLLTTLAAAALYCSAPRFPSPSVS